jgi:AcrR family transcriptional regulator
VTILKQPHTVDTTDTDTDTAGDTDITDREVAAPADTAGCRSCTTCSNCCAATAATEVLGLRARKKLATREAITAASLHLALTRGMSGVTIDAIAEAADVAPRTVFHYYASKEDAVLGVDPAKADRVASAVRARPADEAPLVALRAALHEQLRGRDTAPRTLADRMRVLRENPVLLPWHLAAHTLIEQQIAAVVAERTGTDLECDLYPQLVAAAAATAFRVAVSRATRTTTTAELDTLLDEAFTALAAGLTQAPAAGVEGRTGRTAAQAAPPVGAPRTTRTLTQPELASAARARVLLDRRRGQVSESWIYDLAQG